MPFPGAWSSPNVTTTKPRSTFASSSKGKPIWTGMLKLTKGYRGAGFRFPKLPAAWRLATRRISIPASCCCAKSRSPYQYAGSSTISTAENSACSRLSRCMATCSPRIWSAGGSGPKVTMASAFPFPWWPEPTGSVRHRCRRCSMATARTAKCSIPGSRLLAWNCSLEASRLPSLTYAAAAIGANPGIWRASWSTRRTVSGTFSRRVRPWSPKELPIPNTSQPMAPAPAACWSAPASISSRRRSARRYWTCLSSTCCGPWKIQICPSPRRSTRSGETRTNRPYGDASAIIRRWTT